MKAFSKQPRRVLMLSWEFPPRIVGGISRHVDELSRALVRAGVEVDVLTAHHPGAPREEETTPGLRVLRAGPAPVEPADFIGEIHQLDFGLLERFLTFQRNSLGYREYDLIHAHEWLVGFAARALRFGLEVPLVATIHATESGRNGGIHTRMQQYIHSVEWMLTYDAWRVICCSRAMASEVEQALQVPADKVRVIPNGIDPKRLRCKSSAAELARFRRRWARDDERIVLFVGRLVREKGVEILIDALPEVLSSHPQAKLVVAGAGSREHLMARARAKGLGQKVAFTGFVSEDLTRLYAVAEVAVFPSLYEPFGIVALEAMAAGVPVVASDVGGLREVVTHGVTGIHTWASNAHSLAWGIRQVLADGALAARLRRKARQEVMARFHWDGIAEQTISVYEEALGLARVPAPEVTLDAEAAPVYRRTPAPEAVGPGIRPRYLIGGQPALVGAAGRS
jgi:glycosyltransferase involved in cell wall biosynthesis